MNVIIQCAGSKEPYAGYFRDQEGRRICFVAHPEGCSKPDESFVYARPDDPSDESGKTWRDQLAEYDSGANPYDLLPAYRLYKRSIYRDLVERYGTRRVFILSAGWGLIRSDFLTPNYDLTFSASGEPCTRRGRGDVFEDFCHLPLSSEDAMIFFGGTKYLPLLYDLTRELGARKLVFYRAANPPSEEGFVLRRYETTARQNWHYQCARDLLDGRLDLD